MNARLFVNVLRRREAAPAIVPFLFDAIDRCDPTRSREAKPSERERQRHATRRVLRSLALSAALIAAGLVVLVHYAH